MPTPVAPLPQVLSWRAHMVSARSFVFVDAPRDAKLAPAAQIPWSDEFEHQTARKLFGSNLLALTWIKGEAMPGELVDEILRGLGLERETDEQRRRRIETSMRMRERSQQSGVRSSSSSGLAQMTDEMTDEQRRRLQNLRRLES